MNKYRANGREIGQSEYGHSGNFQAHLSELGLMDFSATKVVRANHI